jgi:hypothetical protein
MMPAMSGRPPVFRDGELWAELYCGASEEREACEGALVAAGFPLPLPHRSAWGRLKASDDSWFLAVRDAGGPRAGFAVAVSRSRALPGHLILRAERFGPGLAGRFRDLAVASLVRLAAANPSVLRVHVETFARADADREALEAALAAHRFRRVDEPRRYARTVAVDLQPDEESILASFHAKTRRDIRAAAKHPVRLAPIRDADAVGRMDELYRETMTRTGGEAKSRDWGAVIALSRDYPDLSRLVGLFRTDGGDPDALLAFAWGCGHGDHAHYDAAASTRRTELKVPLAYPLVWDLMCWAKRHGARWFDFGGVTEGHLGSDDRLGGISDFKRYFSKEVVAVGGEWLLEPHWVRAQLARAVSAGAAALARFRAALSAPRECPRRTTPPRAGKTTPAELDQPSPC